MLILALQGTGLLILGFCLGYVYRGMRGRKALVDTIRTIKAVK